ncbi:MAG: DUF5615 family PIN-like protein [Tepidisphaeraceae bacterium]
MSRPRFLADHNLRSAIIRGVNRAEPTIEFLRARDVQMDARPDPEVLAFAAEQGFIVVTHDVNTMIAHGRDRLKQGLPLPGLLVILQGRPLRSVIESLVLIGVASEAEDWHGQIHYLPL